MTSAERVRGAVSTLADYTLGPVIVMVQLAIADRAWQTRSRAAANSRTACAGGQVDMQRVREIGDH